MRVIRFRGKSVYSGEWVEGHYAILHIPEKDNHDNVVGYKEYHCIFNDELKNRSKGGYWHTVNPATIGQFTGSYDMAGKPIWEGDIVEKQTYPHAGRKRTVVCFETGAFMTTEPEGHAVDTVLACNMHKAWAVVGNIIENPGWACED